MACNPSPTATLFGTSTSKSTSTSVSQSVSSLPDSVTTIESTTCVASSTGTDNLATCVSTSTIDQVSTIPGGQTTVQVTLFATVPVVQSFPTQTLFATCVGGGNTQVPSSQPSPPKTSVIVTVTTTPPSVTTSPPLVTTSPPSVTTSQSSIIMPNGSVVLTTLLVTSSASPSSEVVPVTVTSSQQVQGDGSAHSNVKLAPIIGGAVGGFFVLLIIVALGWLILRKRGAWDDIFDRDDGPIDFRPSRLVRDPSMRMSLDLGYETEPKPYQYGVIGPSITPPFASPPGSPTNPYQPHYIRQSRIQSQNQLYPPDHNQDMPHNRQSSSAEYNRHARQYSADHIQTQHNRRPSATSLLYTPLILPNTTISPEPSMASVYSNSTSRPGYSRETSSSYGTRPTSGHSTGESSASRASTHNSNTAPMPRVPRRLRRPSRPDEFGIVMPPAAGRISRPPSTDELGDQGRRRRSGSEPPLSPRTLMLTNWNPSTDAISFDASAPLSRVSVASREQPRPAPNIRWSVSSAATIPTDMRGAAPNIAAAQAGPNTSENIIMHTDGGTVEQGAPATEVKQMPAEAPPAYSG